MAKISTLPRVDDLLGDELVVLTKEGRTVSGPIGRLLDTLIKPFREKVEADSAAICQQVAGAAAFTNPGIILENGAYVAHANFYSTEFIAIEGSVDYTVTAAASANAYHAWYDANRGFISNFRGPSASNLQTSTHASPANARYARITTTLATKDGAGFKAATARLNIGQVKQITEQHPPGWKGAQDAQLAASTALITTLQGQVADLNNRMDLGEDVKRPLFVLTRDFTRSHKAVAPAEIITIVSRDGPSQFTVAPGKGAKLAVDGALVVYDGGVPGNHTSFATKSIVGDVVTVHGTLPATCHSCEAMHEADQGQHLGRYGYKGLAEYVAKRLKKYAYRKDDRLFTYHPMACTTPAFNNPSIYDRATGTIKLIEVTPLNGAAGGGFVTGTTDLVRACGTSTLDISPAVIPLGQVMPRFYRVQDAVAGRGVEMSYNANGSDGFLTLAVGAAREPYNGGALKTEGRVRLEVLVNGASIFDATYDAGTFNLANVDYPRANTVLIRMTLADSVPTSARLHYAYGYQKSPNTPKTPLIQSGMKAAFLGDSWTQFTLPLAGEVVPKRPDGTNADGMQVFSEHMRTWLAAQGTNITTLNFGKSGMTSAWGLYWVEEVIKAKPNVCFVNFAINDRNSVGSDLTSWDFSPANMWINQPRTSGGMDGRVPSAAAWEDNMQAICDRLLAAGITPIVLLPPDTGSVSQTYVLQRDYLSRLSAGFATPL